MIIGLSPDSTNLGHSEIGAANFLRECRNQYDRRQRVHPAKSKVIMPKASLFYLHDP
jgi:hypothetical protein